MGQIREFKKFAKIIIIIAILKKNEKSQILNIVKNPKLKNSRKFEHAKITISTVYVYHWDQNIQVRYKKLTLYPLS